MAPRALRTFVAIGSPIFSKSRGATLAAFGLLLAGQAATAATTSLQCYGRDFKSVSAQPQFASEIFQLDGTCYSYAATAALEAAVTRKQGRVEQILPTAAALRQSRNADFNLERLLDASSYDEGTGTIGRIPKSFFEGGLVSTVQSSFTASSLGDEASTLPRYDVQALLEYSDFSASLVAESSCQFYSREPQHLELAAWTREYEQRAAQMRKLHREQDDAFARLAKEPELLSGIRQRNTALESLVAENQQLAEKMSKAKKLIAAGTVEDQRIACSFSGKARLFEREMIRKYGSVDIRGIRPLVLYSEFGKPKSECGEKERRQRLDVLTKALCAGIPVAIGTPSMRKFLIRGGLRSLDWRPYAPTGSSGDVVGQGHAMTLKGFTDLGGEPHLIFRNSWGPKSEAALPASEVCSIDEAVIFLDAERPQVAAPGTVLPERSEFESWSSEDSQALKAFSSQYFRKQLLQAEPR